MHEFITEACQAAFQWGSLALIVGAVSARYWNAGRTGRVVDRRSSPARARCDRRCAGDDLSWLSLCVPADGGVSQRDPLSGLGLGGGRGERSQRLA